MPDPSNPLWQWAQNHKTGPGLWRWTHYWDIFHRHLQKFRGRPVSIAEIGVYSGGGLLLWHDYFGPSCTVYGVDIQPQCRKFEREWCKVFIGNQGDREFWKNFKQQVPRLDILIDDGSHDAGHQAITLEEMLPHLQPGGVYLCEDLLNDRNAAFGQRIGEMTTELHPNVDIKAYDMLAMGLSDFQRMVDSIHVYAHVAVIERREVQPVRFESPGMGSEWINFDPEWKG